MENRYRSFVEFKPPGIALGLVLIGSIVLILLARGGVIKSWMIEMAAYILIGFGLLIVIPRLVSWYISIVIQHYAALREANAIDRESIEWTIRERMLNKYEMILSRVIMLDDAQLKAALRIPSPAEIDLFPEAGSFLILANSSEKIPLHLVQDVVEKWIALVKKGRNPWMLPPIRLWSGRERDFVKSLYREMAENGLVSVQESGEPWGGNVTATIRSPYTAEDILIWMRVDDEYQIHQEEIDG